MADKNKKKDKAQISGILDKDINFKNLNFGKILAISFITILVAFTIFSVYNEFRGKLNFNFGFGSDKNNTDKDKSDNTNKYSYTTTKSSLLTTSTNTNTNLNTNSPCSDSDGGKDVWVKGTCNDGTGKTDYCEINFGKILFEYSCSGNSCTKETIDCRNYAATCYDGRCILNTQDSDGDGFLDLDEYEAGTDPFDPNDYPGHGQQLNCSTVCTGAGYNGGRGPVESVGNCNYPEFFYTSNNYNISCCCNPKWYCCSAQAGTKTCRPNNCNSGETNAGTIYTSQSQCQSNCVSTITTTSITTTSITTTSTLPTTIPPTIPLPMQYDCNYDDWPQRITNKATGQILWSCNKYTPYLPYCKAGTSLCCRYDDTVGLYYYCMDMSSQNPTPPSCFDSDSSLSEADRRKTKGYMSTDNGVTKLWDACAGDYLFEWSCVNNAPQKLFINCLSLADIGAGCEDGACKGTSCNDFCIGNWFASGNYKQTCLSTEVSRGGCCCIPSTNPVPECASFCAANQAPSYAFWHGVSHDECFNYAIGICGGGHPSAATGGVQPNCCCYSC